MIGRLGTAWADVTPRAGSGGAVRRLEGSPALARSRAFRRGVARGNYDPAGKNGAILGSRREDEMDWTILKPFGGTLRIFNPVQ